MLNLPAPEVSGLGACVQPPCTTNTTELLVRWSKGDQQALQDLMPKVYDELRRLAGHLQRRERAGHTLQATALVHGAYLRLVDQRRVDWHNRAQFLAVAAQMLRRVLVDHARAKQRLKRGWGTVVLSLEERLVSVPERNLDVVALDEALSELARLDPQQSRIVELPLLCRGLDRRNGSIVGDQRGDHQTGLGRGASVVISPAHAVVS